MGIGRAGTSPRLFEYGGQLKVRREEGRTLPDDRSYIEANDRERERT
jgi:hypothetical protein